MTSITNKHKIWALGLSINILKKDSRYWALSNLQTTEKGSSSPMVWSGPIMYHSRTLEVYAGGSQWGAWGRPLYGPHSWKPHSWRGHVTVSQINGWGDCPPTPPFSAQILRSVLSSHFCPQALTVRQSFTDSSHTDFGTGDVLIIVINKLNKLFK